MPSTADLPDARPLYLDLLKRCLVRYRMCTADQFRPAVATKPAKRVMLHAAKRVLVSRGLELVEREPFDAHVREWGLDRPACAETMVGLRRLDHLEQCVVDVLDAKVPGDLAELGVWRGGTAILMRAVLKAYGVSDRRVWAADSYRGLPRPRARADHGDQLWADEGLAIGLPEVKENFARYGLLDDQVQFLEGWFRDTLPAAPIDRLAVLRLDGDMYESTMDGLTHLYPKVSPGGFVIVDDYGALESCRAAVRDFRGAHGIDEPLESIDWTGVFWRRRG